MSKDVNGFVGVTHPSVSGRCVTVEELRDYLSKLAEIGRGNWPVAVVTEFEDDVPQSFYPSWDGVTGVVLLDPGDEVAG